ncbi:MAG TPA: carboxyltransferase domain-containing protein, partial [Gillisia sp.]|nr:carboxyltransferase domain-containing protein [Gillisia sp.]
MNSKSPRIRAMGERAILIEFEPEISENTLGKVLFYKKKIEDHYFEVKVEVINTYNSLLVYYLYTIEYVYDEVLVLKGLFQGTKIKKKTIVQLYNIPVCYDAEFGLDLKLISREKNLSPDQIIRLHTQPIYTVYFIGFLPGFLYLGGLDKKLQISRKIQP